MGLTHTKYSDIWTARKRPNKTSTREMETYMFKQIKMMINPNWQTEAWYPENQLYKELQQSTMQSWLSQTQIMTMMTQTQDNQTIHPRNCKETPMPRINFSHNGNNEITPS